MFANVYAGDILIAVINPNRRYRDMPPPVTLHSMIDPRYRPDGRSNRARMLVGDPYLADDTELADANLRATRLTLRYNATDPADTTGRDEILRQLLGTLGGEVVIRPPFFVDYGFNIHVGPRVFINNGMTALDVAAITIGADTLIGPNVQLLTPTHPVEPEPRRQKWEAAQPITLGNNVWLGGGVIVCPGVTIGDNTVVGAGAVVSRSLPANVVAVGNPARVVRSI